VRGRARDKGFGEVRTAKLLAFGIVERERIPGPHLVVPERLFLPRKLSRVHPVDHEGPIDIEEWPPVKRRADMQDDVGRDDVRERPNLLPDVVPHESGGHSDRPVPQEVEQKIVVSPYGKCALALTKHAIRAEVVVREDNPERRIVSEARDDRLQKIGCELVVVHEEPDEAATRAIEKRAPVSGHPEARRIPKIPNTRIRNDRGIEVAGVVADKELEVPETLRQDALDRSAKKLGPPESGDADGDCWRSHHPVFS
jgi:hypothetical protein